MSEVVPLLAGFSCGVVAGLALWRAMLAGQAATIEDLGRALKQSYADGDLLRRDRDGLLALLREKGVQVPHDE